jgi:ATP-binding cassette subfamily F protein uup
LFAKPANVIVLDEPTNDLDAETLELLETRLVEFPGTLLLVSHDRTFLNNVVTSTIAFESDGFKEYVGGYDDWLRQSAAVDKPVTGQMRTARSKSSKPCGSEDKRRLSYNEQRELAALPATIEQLESEISAMHQTMADPAFYQLPSGQIAAAQSRHTELERNLAAAYARWEELEQLA